MIFTTILRKIVGARDKPQGLLMEYVENKNGESVLTIPRAKKIDNTLLFSWKIYFFFNKRGGDDIYNDDMNVCLFVCHKKSPLSQVVARRGF